MRYEIAQKIRAFADRVDGGLHAAFEATNEAAAYQAGEVAAEDRLRKPEVVTLHIDGKGLHQELLAMKRRNGGRDLGLS